MSVGKFPGLDALQQGCTLGVGGLPGVEGLFPFLAGFRAAVNHGAGVGQDFLVHVEGLGGVEAQDFLQGCNFLGAQGGTVDLARVLLLGSRVADDGAQRNDGRLGRLGLGGAQGGVQLHRAEAVKGSVVNIEPEPSFEKFAQFQLPHRVETVRRRRPCAVDLLDAHSGQARDDLFDLKADGG